MARGSIQVIEPGIQQKQTVRERGPVRRGVSATLTVLYLILFSALALGFYSSVNSAIAIGDNAAVVSNSRLAAESGMEFIRAQLAAVRVSSSADAERAFSDLHAQLAAAMEGKPNLAGRKVVRAGGIIQVPASNEETIILDITGASFRAEIERVAGGLDLQVRVFGKTAKSDATRSIRMDLQAQPAEGPFLKYGPPVQEDIEAVLNGMNAAAPAAPTPLSPSPRYAGERAGVRGE